MLVLFARGRVSGSRPHLSLMVLWVPVIAAIQLVLMLGLSMFLSALTVFYRDIGIVIGPPAATAVLRRADPVVVRGGTAAASRSCTTRSATSGVSILRYNPIAVLLESYRTAIYGVTAARRRRAARHPQAAMDVPGLALVSSAFSRRGPGRWARSCSSASSPPSRRCSR